VRLHLCLCACKERQERRELRLPGSIKMAKAREGGWGGGGQSEVRKVESRSVEKIEELAKNGRAKEQNHVAL
jgi:hypothetical protein